MARWLDPSEVPSSEELFFRRYIRPGDVVIDAGANIGFFTLVASVLVSDLGKVYSIEAHPRIFKYLEGNVAINKCKNVHTYNIALGDKNGTINFSNKKDDDQNFIQPGLEIEVQMAELDGLGITDDYISLLKIDVEGYEKFVLEGAVETLRRVQCIFFESWEEHFSRYGYTCGDIFKILHEQGFRVFRIVHNVIFPVPETYVSKKCENLVALRETTDFMRRTGFTFEKQ